jgi:hypothetical protein
MPTYVVESYFPRGRADQVADVAAGVRRAAQELASEGSAVRYERMDFLAEDELCLHFFEAVSREIVARVAERAGLVCDRVVETTTSHG